MNQTTPGAGPPPLPPRTPAPRPARSMTRGCLIAVIVVAGLAVPVVAILAAIALPAYDDYLTRSKVMQALAEASPTKLQVEEFHAQQGRCPVPDDDAIALDLTLATAVLDAAGEGHCMIELRLQDPKDTIDGGHLWLDYDAVGGQWECSSDLDERYLPATCRE